MLASRRRRLPALCKEMFRCWQVLAALDTMAAEFEEAVRLAGGWADLALPSAEDAALYFASFRRAPPDNSALVPGPQVRGNPTSSPWKKKSMGSSFFAALLECVPHWYVFRDC